MDSSNILNLDPGLCYQLKKKIIKNNLREKQFSLKINLFLNFKKIMALVELFKGTVSREKFSN